MKTMPLLLTITIVCLSFLQTNAVIPISKSQNAQFKEQTHTSSFKKNDRKTKILSFFKSKFKWKGRVNKSVYSYLTLIILTATLLTISLTIKNFILLLLSVLIAVISISYVLSKNKKIIPEEGISDAGKEQEQLNENQTKEKKPDTDKNSNEYWNKYMIKLFLFLVPISFIVGIFFFADRIIDWLIENI